MASNIQNVSLTAPTDYSAEGLSIERRRRLAEQLYQQSQEPLQTNQTAGGYVIPVSPLAGLAKALNQGIAGYGMAKADKSQRDLAAKYQSDLTNTLARAQALGAGTPASPYDATEFGGDSGMNPAVAPDRQAMIQALMGHPATQGQGTAMMMSQFAAPERVDLGDKIGLIKDGALVGSIPKGATPDATMREAGTDRRYATPSANALVSAQTARDTSVLNPDVVAAKTGIAAAGKPSVSVKVDTKMGESLAKPIGEIVTGTRDMALAAIDQLDAAKRIGAALDSGKVIVGPGADARLWMAQLGQVIGVGGKSNEETLVNTRNTIKGLAEFTLSARKQLKGQGQVSDFESKLIEKASSGDVTSMTVPEIKTLVSVSDRLARKAYALHERNMENLRSGEYKGLANYYAVPPLPDGGPPKPAGGAAPFNDPSEEAAYQAWKAQHK